MDGARDAYIDLLLERFPSGLDAIYGCTVGYSACGTADSKRQFLLTHVVSPQLFHVGTPAQTARQIRGDRDLRDALDASLDRLTPPSIAHPAPSSLWNELRQAVSTPPSRTAAWETERWEGGPRLLRWIATSAEGRLSRVRPKLTALAIVVAILAALILAMKYAQPFGPYSVAAGVAALSMAAAGWMAVLSGWPAPGGRLSWPVVRVLLAAGLAGSLLVSLPRLPLLAAGPSGISGWAGTSPLAGPLGYAVLSLVAAGVRAAGSWGPAVVTAVLSAVAIGVALVLVEILALPPMAQPLTPISRAQLAALQDAEDRDVQNHMSALVRVPPVWYRILSLRVLLWLLNALYYRPFLTGGKLVTIPTVHFAQWVLLGSGHFLFLSNYDHSWSRYLDDFGTRITSGIVKLWAQGRGFPGVADLPAFKEYARSTMVPHAVWYSAYSGLTVRQIWTNKRLRADLFAPLGDEAAVAGLGRLSLADPL